MEVAAPNPLHNAITSSDVSTQSREGAVPLYQFLHSTKKNHAIVILGIPKYYYFLKSLKR